MVFEATPKKFRARGDLFGVAFILAARPAGPALGMALKNQDKNAISRCLPMGCSYYFESVLQQLYASFTVAPQWRAQEKRAGTQSAGPHQEGIAS